MKNLLLNLADWRDRLRREPLAVFLDYDGTLAAIAPSPAEAALPYATREILKGLVRLRNVKAAVVSGRALGVLQAMIQVPGLSYVGSHGAEFCSPGMTSRFVTKKYYRMLQGLAQSISSGSGGMRGVLFEQKPVSFAIHYRKAAVSVERKIKRVVSDICADAVLKGQVSIIHGKKVVEIMPPNAINKGQAVKRLWHKWGKNKFLPIFIGDDRTDEPAFKIVRGCGITVRVGASNAGSNAEYCLRSVDEVRELLGTICYLR